MKKKDLTSVKKEDFIKSYDAFLKYDGITTPKTSYYTSFLSKALGYIYGRCKDGENANNVMLDLISQIAKAINSKGSVNLSAVQEEKGRINEALSEREYQDVTDKFLIGKLNIDFATAAANFFLHGRLSKQGFIDYVLVREGITPISETKVVSQNIVRDFVNYLVSAGAHIDLNADELTKVLCEMVETEKRSFAISQTEYENKYPCLTKAVLLQNARREIAELMTECSNNPTFSYCLGKLLAELSRYDIDFLRNISASIPYSKLSEKIYEAFLSDLLIYKVAMAINPHLYDELPGVAITPKELMACIPDFVKNMKECYSDSNDDSDYADKIASVISKYCISENGRRYNAEQVKGIFDKKFGSSNKK